MDAYANYRRMHAIYLVSRRGKAECSSKKEKKRKEKKRKEKKRKEKKRKERKGYRTENYEGMNTV